MTSPPHLHISLRGPALALPGGRIAGTATWTNLTDPSKLFLRLYWLAENKRGGSDLGIVAEQPIPFAQASGSLDFEFPLPDGPPSFVGDLLTLQWGVEAVAGRLAGRATFVLGPGGSPVKLTPLPDEPSERGGCNLLRREHPGL